MRNGLLKSGGVAFVGVMVLAVLEGQGSHSARHALAAPDRRGYEQGVFAFSSSLDKDRQLLYVIDAGSQRICIYRVQPNGPSSDLSLELEAVRNYAADLHLTEFNTKPSVAKIEGMLGQTLKRP